jgi:diacylglycerol kinase (ATP)
MNNDLPLIIVNPQSAGGLNQVQWASQANIVRRNFGPFECVFTKSPWDAAKISEEQARKGRKLIVAMGGDGTTSEVANGIVQSGVDVELGILPRGTGGDFRRTLSIPSQLDKAARKLKDANSHQIDLGKVLYVNHEGHEELRYFINTASFGMSGEVARRVNRAEMKWLGGKVAYASATLRTSLGFSNPDVSIQLNDQNANRLRIAIVCIANGRYFGGGMKIAPEAKLNDGWLDVITIGALPLAELLTKSYRIYTGTHLKLKEVGFAHARKLVATPIDADEQIMIEVDGETPGRLPATFEIVPGALRIRC